ncbi:MAG TPA: DUF1841 family protein [Nitrospiria bacterium]|nr:DUF1841 family protein [Nitrospiria bacterium]
MSAFGKENQIKFVKVAEKIKGKIPLEGDDENLIATVMFQHPEFDPIWELGELSAAPHEINGDVVNPFVHTALHLSMEKQIGNNDPEEVIEVIQQMLKEGNDRHEVIHKIGGIYAAIYFNTFRKGQLFEDISYIELVRNLIQK